MITFRNAKISDAERLLEIYRYYVEKTAISFEWTTPTVEEFRKRMEHTIERYPYIVAVQDGRIIGYAYVSPFVGRKAYDWSVETTIYMDPKERHQGAGKKLYFVLEEILREMHILNLNACIGYPKEDDAYLTKNSAQFHEHLGYRLVGTFHNSGYKFGRWYDMVWMEKMIGEHPADPVPVQSYPEISGKFAGTLLSE